MTIIGLFMCDRIRRRIESGVNVNDAPARPLNPAYQKSKGRRGLSPLRDWTWRGQTLRSLNVKRANDNSVTIGFTDPRSDRLAAINNHIERAFGVSPEDRKALGDVRACDRASGAAHPRFRRWRESWLKKLSSTSTPVPCWRPSSR